MTVRTSLPVWQKLQHHAEQMQACHMNQLFADDKQRFGHFSLKLPRLLFDYSKNRINQETLELLMQLARDVEVEQWREKMFAGEHINVTEDRAVLHTALRDRSDKPQRVDGIDIKLQVQTELQRMAAFVAKVRDGQWTGHTGKPIRDIVNIGIGGSDLGPKMVTEALKGYSDQRLSVHYVSNVDGALIADILRPLNPESVLFVISSKTFTTAETMTNARTARNWLVSSAFDAAAVAKHFVAVTTNTDAAVEFGLDQDNLFSLWDWVGGRYSLWSAIGLPIALSLGFEQFIALLEGAEEMDKHFRESPLEHNAPVIMALLSVWNCTFLGYKAQAILPYDQTMRLLPAYLQQAEMESNGKSVNWQGDTVDYPTVPLIWGEVGINGQHAFYQYLHQGNNIVPADFIGSVVPVTAVAGHHDTLMANFFAQSQALMSGVDEQQVKQQLKGRGHSAAQIKQLTPHKVHQGNRPSNTLLMQRLDAKTLGNLIALYEHKIFVQGVVLQIYSFDQWGVELGKGLAANIQKELITDGIVGEHDSSTTNLIAYYKAGR